VLHRISRGDNEAKEIDQILPILTAFPMISLRWPAFERKSSRQVTAIPLRRA
jgi:hypothetical protein